MSEQTKNAITGWATLLIVLGVCYFAWAEINTADAERVRHENFNKARQNSVIQYHYINVDKPVYNPNIPVGSYLKARRKMYELNDWDEDFD